MKHTITFYTDNKKIKDIHDIKVSFYDQDNRIYSMSVKHGKKIENIINIDNIINERLAILNNKKGLNDEQST